MSPAPLPRLVPTHAVRLLAVRLAQHAEPERTALAAMLGAAIADGLRASWSDLSDEDLLRAVRDAMLKIAEQEREIRAACGMPAGRA